MSSSNVLVNDKVRIKVKFVDIDSTTGDQVEVEPVPPVPVTVKDSSGNLIESGNATALTASTYYYDYTPTQPGTYTVKFVGTIVNLNFATPTTTQIPVSQQLYVSTPTEEYRPTITLRESETITFAPNLIPLYIDPETIRSYFPDATLLEIGELVHGFSHEINTIFGITDPNLEPASLVEEDYPNPVDILSNYGVNPYTIFEYIKAAVCCELSRTYGFGGDDELSLQLADLQITNRSFPRNSVNRGNATTWCQIAAALRKEIVAFKVGMSAVLPKGLPAKRTESAGVTVDPATGGLIYLSDKDLYGKNKRITPKDDPMPDRGLRKYD